jgi:translation initiation factor 3 subunit B
MRPLRHGSLVLLCLGFSDDELEAEELGETDTGFGNVIVVDNLPVVDSAKYEKLLGVLKKIFSQIGSIRENGLWMPMREDVNKSTGFAFIEYNSPEVK